MLISMLIIRIVFFLTLTVTSLILLTLIFNKGIKYLFGMRFLSRRLHKMSITLDLTNEFLSKVLSKRVSISFSFVNYLLNSFVLMIMLSIISDNAIRKK